jgi:Alpha-L-fucosidase
MVRSPNAEDYANAMRDPGSPTADYYRNTCGDMAYEGFQQIFEREVADFDADDWAETFQRAGADDVVMVAKYHDGYSLWPTKVPNPTPRTGTATATSSVRSPARFAPAACALGSTPPTAWDLRSVRAPGAGGVGHLRPPGPAGRAGLGAT